MYPLPHPPPSSFKKEGGGGANYEVVFKILLYLKITYFKENPWVAISVKSSPSLPVYFITSSLFQFLMTSSKFTEHFPGLNNRDKSTEICRLVQINEWNS